MVLRIHKKIEMEIGILVIRVILGLEAFWVFY